MMWARVVVASLAALLAGCAGGAVVGSAPATPSTILSTSAPTPGTSPSSIAITSPSATPTPVVSATTIPSSSQKWVSAWADAPTGAGPGPIVDMTVRQIVMPTVGSRGTIRLHFSNYFGSSAITIGSVHVGVQKTAAAVTGDVPVTFGAAKSVTIAAGGFATSDVLSYRFSYGSILAVTEYIEGSNPVMTFHEQGMGKVTSYQTAANAGDETADTGGSTFTGTTLNTYLLDRVDVLGDYKETVVAFGSSTTDGYQDNGGGVDLHMSWPEQLAAALHAAGHDDIAVANEGIAGNTAAYPLTVGASAPVPNPVSGQPGFMRFSRDVLTVPGAGVLIEYLGADDIRNYCDPMASGVVPYKRGFVNDAHAAGMRVFEATTAPTAYCEVQNPAGFGTRFPQGIGEEAERFALVGWESATAPVIVDSTLEQPSGADGFIDFNGALTDPANLSYMLPQYDSGDDVHPNSVGYAAMVRAIPLSQL